MNDMTVDDRRETFKELIRLLPRISIEQPALMDSLEVLSRLLEAVGSAEGSEQDELLLRALTDSSSQGRSLAAGLLSLRMGLYARLERQACLDLALAGVLGLSDVRRLAEERIHRPMGKSLRAEVLYLLQCRDERLDGSGPMGLSGEELDISVGILSTVCAYIDRLAQGWSGLRAMTFIHGERALFNEGSVLFLVQALSVFPIGSYVALDSGEKGRVVGARPENPLRPIVCVRLRADGGIIEPPLLHDQENAPRIASLLAEPWAGVPGPEETGSAWLQGLHERLSSWPPEAGQSLPEGLSGDWGRPSSELARRQEEAAREQRQRLSAIQAEIDQSKSALAALLAAIDLQRQKLGRMEEARSQSREALRRRLERRRAYHRDKNERIKKRVEALAGETQRRQREQERILAAIQAEIELSKTALAGLLEAEPRREEEARAALLELRREMAAELRRFRAEPKLKDIKLRLTAQQKRLENQIKTAAEAASALQEEKIAERQACRKAIDLQRRKLRRMKEDQERALAESRRILGLRLDEKRSRYQRQAKKIEKIEAIAAEVERQQQQQRRQLAAIQADIDRSRSDLAALLEVDERRQENETRAVLLELRREAAVELRRLRADHKLKNVRLRLAEEQKRLADQQEASANAVSALLQEKARELEACWEKINLQRRELSRTKEERNKARTESREVLRLRIERWRARHWNRIELLERQIQEVASETERERRLLAQLKGPVEALEKAAAPPAAAGEETAQDPRLAAIQSDIDKAETALAALIDAERRQKDDERAALLRLRQETAVQLRRLRIETAPPIDEARLRLRQAEEHLEAQRKAFAQALEKGQRAISARQERWIAEKKSLESSLLEKRRRLEDLRRAILEAAQRREETEASVRRASAEFEQKAATLLARARLRLAARRAALEGDLSSLKAETEQAGRQRAEALEAFQKRRDCLEEDIRRLRGEWGDLQGLISANETEESALRQALTTTLSDLDLRLLEARFALDTARKETAALSQEQERRLKEWERAGRELEVLAQQYNEVSGQTEPLLDQWRELAGQGLADVSAVFRAQLLNRAHELGLWSARLSEIDRRLGASRAAFQSQLFVRCREAGLRAFQEGRLDEARVNLRRALSMKSDDETQNLLARLEGLPRQAPEKEEPGP